MIYNTKNNIECIKANERLQWLMKNDKRIELKEIKVTRTSTQNRALHLFFTHVSDALNNIGIPFIYRGLKGDEMEMQWTGELFKQMTWKPIQKALFGTDRTRDLKKTKEIDMIFDVICKFFAEKGIEISFPNEFDYYLKFYTK